ncbi:GFA family protein [Chromobacterium paludis]
MRYRLRGMPYRVTHCHCRSCRHASGAGLCPHRGYTLTYVSLSSR